MSSPLAFTIVGLLLLAPAAHTQELEGVQVPDAIALHDDTTTLMLNGAGVRRHFIFSAYVAALYLPERADTPEGVLAAPLPKRIHLHLLRDVSADDMMRESLERFRTNASEDAYRLMRERVDEFHGAFPDLRAGDVVHIDMVPAGTEIWINGWLLAEIPGNDFQEAVLKLWLGDDPADPGLKQAMLGRE